MEENAVELLHHYGDYLPPYFLIKNFNPFRKNNNMVAVPFPLYIFMPLPTCCSSVFNDSFPSYTDLYPLIRPSIRPLASDRARTLILGFIRSPPTLAAYDITPFLPSGYVGRDFPFTEDETL